MRRRNIAIVGGGPAGLMAAEVLSASGHDVTIYEAMPTVARKFLLAGKSGLNITHSEDHRAFATRFGAANASLAPALAAFGPDAVRAWADALGAETFVGTSGRVFPAVMKASPLLRAWLRRLEAQGVTLLTRHRWVGFDGDRLIIEAAGERRIIKADATLLALGGASWPRLGSDAAWTAWLAEKGVEISPFRPANCGFDVHWSPFFAERFAGAPLKGVTATSGADPIPGEFVVSRHGIEGSLVYAHAARLRDQIERDGRTTLTIDLMPGRPRERIARDLARQPAKASLSNRLRKGAGLDAVKSALMRECMPDFLTADANRLAAAIKALPIPLVSPRPLAEAISSAGGVSWSALDQGYMLKALPGTFVAGEMIDWEASTGGYLLTACLATGRAAARGIEAWFDR